MIFFTSAKLLNNIDLKSRFAYGYCRIPKNNDAYWFFSANYMQISSSLILNIFPVKVGLKRASLAENTLTGEAIPFIYER